jgi:hypothetical protein
VKDSARDRVSGSEPTDGRSVMLSRIATASAVAASAISLAVRPEESFNLRPGFLILSVQVLRNLRRSCTLAHGEHGIHA